jgi:uncharacterized BrkB/YihY/UPF0761 family membrane protein
MMNFAHALDRLDSRQRRAPVLAIPVPVIKKFVDDGVDKLGVQAAYWGFFSDFALLLVFASILGFVFQSGPGFQRQLLDSTLERMPVIGPPDQRRHRVAHRQRRRTRRWCSRRALDRPWRHPRDR